MKLLSYGKDGGQESTVWGFWLVEIKRLFSVALLCFEDGSRDAFHSHAFNSVSWVLKGKLWEEVVGQKQPILYLPSWRPIVTRSDRFHKVTSYGRTWVLTFRGSWARTWREYWPKKDRFVTLTNGRKVVA